MPAKKKPVPKKPAAKKAAPAKRKPATKKAPRAKPAAGSHADLLRAILENPDDDKARLVYADALQDTGDPRGEFIVLSLATGKPAAERAELLLAKHRQKEWQNFGAKGARFNWRRGFIDNVGAEARALAAAGSLMWEVEPIRGLSIYGDGKGQLSKILGFPLRIRSLSTGIAADDDARALASATTLGNLDTLELSNLSNAGATVLSTSTAMPKLRSLRIVLAGLGDAGFVALANGPVLASVTELYLGQNNLGLASIEAIANAPWARKLEKLSLSENPVGDAGVAALVRSPNLGALRTLDIANSYRRATEPTLGVGAADALVAAATTTLAKLATLDLSWNLPYGVVDRVKAAFGKRLMMRVDRFD